MSERKPTSTWPVHMQGQGGKVAGLREQINRDPVRRARVDAYKATIIETCSDCGIEQPIVWTAPDDLYIAVMGRKDGDTPCPSCFDTRAAAQGRFLRWVPREETPE